MKIGYMRVSTQEQNLDRQEKALMEAGVEKIFYEKVSAKNSDREQLKNLLEYIREGDIVYIESISRLGRSLQDLLNIIQIFNKKGVGLISLKESHIDTTSPQGKLVFNIFASLSEFERECIRQRQLEGIAIAKAKGKYKGRQKIMVNTEEFNKVYERWKSGKITATKAMQILGLKRNTFYRRIKEYEANKGA
jgi:DNA invertase Pin-like site-specific DNA recombinase